MQLWDDSGSGGKPASIWLVNSAQAQKIFFHLFFLFSVLGRCFGQRWATAHHTSPVGTGPRDISTLDMQELAADSISFDYSGRPSVHVWELSWRSEGISRLLTLPSLSGRLGFNRIQLSGGARSCRDLPRFLHGGSFQALKVWTPGGRARVVLLEPLLWQPPTICLRCLVALIFGVVHMSCGQFNPMKCHCFDPPFRSIQLAEKRGSFGRPRTSPSDIESATRRRRPHLRSLEATTPRGSLPAGLELRLSMLHAAVASVRGASCQSLKGWLRGHRTVAHGRQVHRTAENCGSFKFKGWRRSSDMTRCDGATMEATARLGNASPGLARANFSCFTRFSDGHGWKIVSTSAVKAQAWAHFNHCRGIRNSNEGANPPGSDVGRPHSRRRKPRQARKGYQPTLPFPDLFGYLGFRA